MADLGAGEIKGDVEAAKPACTRETLEPEETSTKTGTKSEEVPKVVTSPTQD